VEDLSATLRSRLEPLLNKPGPRKWSARPVELAAILNFCEAVEDANPIYWDPGTAAASRFGRVIAPPQALMTLALDPPWIPQFLRDRDADAEAGRARSPQNQARAILREYGFATVTVVSREEEYFEPFGPGDGRLGMVDRVAAVSDVKKTRVGPGVFFTYEIDYHTEHEDRLVARARNVTLIYDGTGGTQ
jgi:uncharacterized protein